MGRLKTNSFILHIIAMFCMLLDHMWGTIVPGNQWMTCIGRLAFPIFAFLITEGYFHTHDLKAYIRRLFLFALISELPFNLMSGGELIYPIHQNVLWTFLIALFTIRGIERIKGIKYKWLSAVLIVGIIFVSYIVATIAMVDYYGYGVLTVLVFYFFHEKKWYCVLLKCACIIYINAFMIAGLGYEIAVFNHVVFISQQAFAILALIPIFLYDGSQGPYNKTIKRIYYWFYPAHALVIALIYFLCF